MLSNLSSRQQYLLNDMASSKVEICLKKKTYPEHKYSVNFVTVMGKKHVTKAQDVFRIVRNTRAITLNLFSKVG